MLRRLLQKPSHAGYFFKFLLAPYQLVTPSTFLCFGFLAKLPTIFTIRGFNPLSNHLSGRYGGLFVSPHLAVAVRLEFDACRFGQPGKGLRILQPVQRSHPIRVRDWLEPERQMPRCVIKSGYLHVHPSKRILGVADGTTTFRAASSFWCVMNSAPRIMSSSLTWAIHGGRSEGLCRIIFSTIGSR